MSYEFIAEAIASGSSLGLSITNIPQDFGDLVITGNLKSNGGDVTLEFNDSSSTIIRKTEVRTPRDIEHYIIDSTIMNSNYPLGLDGGAFTLHALDYSNTNKHTTLLGQVTTANDVAWLGLIWQNNAGISSVSITSSSTNFSEGSKLTVYGVKK